MGLETGPDELPVKYKLVCSTKCDEQGEITYTREANEKEYCICLGSGVLLPGVPSLLPNLVLLQDLPFTDVELVFTSLVPKKLYQLGLITNRADYKDCRYYYRASNYVAGEALVVYEPAIRALGYYTGDLQYLRMHAQEMPDLVEHCELTDERSKARTISRTAAILEELMRVACHPRRLHQI
jgi:hypothetical protein